jgi:hypothetical protein
MINRNHSSHLWIASLLLTVPFTSYAQEAQNFAPPEERASWEYRPLSFIYLVFNDTRIDGMEQPFSEQQLIGKITFLKQF